MSVVPVSPLDLMLDDRPRSARGGAPVGTGARSRLSLRSTILTVALLLVFAAALWLRRDLVGQSLARIADLPAPWLAAVVVTTLGMVFARACMVAAATPGLAAHRALAADQVQMASSNAVVGGGPLGASAKVGMLHSWGVKSDDIATSLIATAVAPALVTWGVALTLFWPAVALGDAGNIELLLAIIGTVQIIGFSALLWVALNRPGLAAGVGRIAERAMRTIARVVPRRFVTVRTALTTADPHDWLERLRQDGQRLARSHGIPTLAATVAFQVTTWVLLWSVLHGVGVTDVSFGEVVMSMALVRALVSITPTPGGLGVAELSLVASLTNAGGTPEAVTAAVVLFRSLTYLLPMVLGATAWIWFRRPARLRRSLTAS
jgi:uncharacterized membrane protein YbhN (UPF0104 family)